MNKIFLAALPFAALVGCGGDDGGTVIVKPDAPPVQPPDAFVPVECKAMESYPGFANTRFFATDNPASGNLPHYQDFQGDLLVETDTLDVFRMFLFQDPDSGPFMGGIQPDTYTFDRSMDASIDIWIWPKLPKTTTTLPQDYLDKERYLAFSGTLNLQQVSTTVGGDFAAMFTNLEFVHVIANGNQLMAADDDGMGGTCVATLASASMSAKYTAPFVQGPIKYEIKKLGLPVVKANNYHPIHQ